MPVSHCSSNDGSCHWGHDTTLPLHWHNVALSVPLGASLLAQPSIVHTRMLCYNTAIPRSSVHENQVIVKNAGYQSCRKICLFFGYILHLLLSCIRSTADNRQATYVADGLECARSALYLVWHCLSVRRQHAVFCEGVQLQQCIQDSTEAREKLTSQVELLNDSVAAAESAAQRLQQQLRDQQQGEAQQSGGAGPPPAMPGIGVSANCAHNTAVSSMLLCAHQISGRLLAPDW